MAKTAKKQAGDEDNERMFPAAVGERRAAGDETGVVDGPDSVDSGTFDHRMGQGTNRSRKNVDPYTDWAALPLYLNAKDLARLLRTSPRAIYQQHQRGQLPPIVDVGQRRLLWERDVVLGWLGQRRTTSRGDTSR